MNQITKENILNALKIQRKLDWDNIPKYFLNDKEIMLEAISISYHYSKFFSDELLNDKEFLLECCKIQPHVIQYFTNFQDDNEIAVKILQSSGSLLSFFSERIQHDDKFLKLAMNSSYFTFAHLPEKFKNDKKFILENLVQYKFYLNFPYFPEHLKTDSQIIELSLKNRGCNISEISPKDRENRHYNLIAVQHEPEAIKFIHGSYRKDKEIIESVISHKKSGYLILHASKDILEDEDLVIKAFKNGKNLKIVDNLIIKKNTSLVKKLIDIDIKCLGRVNFNIINDTEFLKNTFFNKIDQLEKLSKSNKIQVLFRVLKNKELQDIYTSIYSNFEHHSLSKNINGNVPVITDIYNIILKEKLSDEIIPSQHTKKKTIKF